MVASTTKSRKASVKKPSSSVRWLMAVAGICAVAAVGVMSASFLSHDQGSREGTAGLCPNLDIDENTGKVRDKGLIPCDRLSAQNGRLDIIRDSFKGR
jgi:hypothetical protein